MTADPNYLRARRALLRGSLAVAAASVLPVNPALAAGKNDPRKLPAQVGDELSFPSWEQAGRLLHPDDVVTDAPPLLVYPRDPATATIRERSRLNQILILRIAPDALTDTMRELSADGLIAYSGLCTHTACAVSEWNAESRHLLCPCHGSEFDPLARGKRTAGPAVRALPALPLAVDGERVVIAGPFTAGIGANA